MSEKNDQTPQTEITEGNEEAMENAEAIIKRFGGIRPMASKMHVPVTTVQGWKKRNVIPGNRREDVMRAATSHNIDLSNLPAATANENGPATDSKEKDAVKTADTGTQTAAPAVKNVAPANNSAKPPAAAATTDKSNTVMDEKTVMEKITAAQKKAVWQSVWIALALVVATACIGAFLLWPAQQKIDANSQKLSMIEGVAPEKTGGFDALTKRFDDMKAASAQWQSDLTQRLDAVEQKITALNLPPELAGLAAKLDSLQQSTEGQAQMDSAMTDLRTLVEGLQGRMDTFEAALVEAKENGTALGQTLQNVPPADMKAAAALLTLGQFRDSLGRNNAPFAEDLALMQKMLGENDPELAASIERLAPYAEQGVLTPSGLTTEFKDLAGDIVTASLAGEEVSVREKALARFNEVVQVKKDGELVTGTDTQARVARAQSLLESGDIEAAIKELQALEGPAAQAAMPWIEKAQNTMLAQNVKAMLTDKIGAMLRRASAPEPVTITP